MPVGYSLGGMFARLFASTNPADLAGLVLVDPVPPGLPSQDIRHPFMSEAEREFLRGAYASRLARRRSTTSRVTDRFSRPRCRRRCQRW